MLKLEIENSYIRDFKLAIKQNLITQDINHKIEVIVKTLQIPEPLPKDFKPHSLTGDYKGYMDCHIKGDLVLIYKTTDTALHLVRIGKHTTIFKKF